MTKLPEYCGYTLVSRDHEQVVCYRGPVAADFFTSDDLHGERHVISLCALHDSPAARRYAMAKGITRRSRKADLEVVA